MFAVAGGGIQNFEILYKFLNSNKAQFSIIGKLVTRAQYYQETYRIGFTS